jgi:hypothetical protein
MDFETKRMNGDDKNEYDWTKIDNAVTVKNPQNVCSSYRGTE